MPERRERIVSLLAGVLRQTLADHHATSIVVLDDGTGTELCRIVGELAAHGGVVVVSAQGDGAEAVEQQRCRARILATERNALVAHPASKTALLLGRIPPEPLLPLGDLYETQIAELLGVPPAEGGVSEFGGAAAVDRALSQWFDERRMAREATAHLPEHARGPFLEVVRAGRDRRRRVGLVPKLSARTLGVDLFD